MLIIIAGDGRAAALLVGSGECVQREAQERRDTVEVEFYVIVSRSDAMPASPFVAGRCAAACYYHNPHLMMLPGPSSRA